MTIFRKWMLLLLALCLTLSAFGGVAETATVDVSALREKYEENALNVVQALANYACDNLNLYGNRSPFDRKTELFEQLRKFDGGWFSKTRSRAVDNLKTDKWEVVSDTEFTVNATCDFTIVYAYNRSSETFHCGWKLTYRRADAGGAWALRDVNALPNESDALKAALYNSKHDDITLYPVTTHFGTGYMAVLEDPSRMYVGTIPKFGSKITGMRIDDLCAKYNAAGGMNGGGFEDAGGAGKGGMPFGLVISQGKQLKPHTPKGEASSVVIGFDENDKLIVGKYKSNEIEGLKLRDAMAFNYALVQDGAAVQNKNVKVAYTTRTALGQDADGRVLMLVIKGREPDSLGATLDELTEIMLQFGAVNAANLDGGTSTCLYLNGESIYSGFRLDCSRSIPTAFLIAPVK